MTGPDPAPDPDELLPPVETGIEIEPLEERDEVISGAQDDTTVPGLGTDAG